jgi:hypothetical protein
VRSRSGINVAPSASQPSSAGTRDASGETADPGMRPRPDACPRPDLAPVGTIAPPGSVWSQLASDLTDPRPAGSSAGNALPGHAAASQILACRLNGPLLLCLSLT